LQAFCLTLPQGWETALASTTKKSHLFPVQVDPIFGMGLLCFSWMWFAELANFKAVY